MKPNIELNIEKLILRGFNSREAYFIKIAIEQELTHLFEKSGAPASLSNETNLRRLDAGAFHVQAQPGAERIGRQIAQTVYAGFSTNRELYGNR